MRFLRENPGLHGAKLRFMQFLCIAKRVAMNGGNSNLFEKLFPQSARTKKTNLLKMYDSSFSFFILAVDCFHPSELSGCSSMASSGRACVCGASTGGTSAGAGYHSGCHVGCNQHIRILIQAHTSCHLVIRC